MSIIENLLVIQDHDCRIRQMEKELKDIPARKKDELSRLDAHKKAVEDAKNVHKSRQADLKKLELDAESHRDRINKLRSQQMGLKTNKEFEAMEDEIRGVGSDITRVEDQELVIMESIEKARLDVVAKEKILKDFEALVNVDVKGLDDRAATLGAKVSELKSLRAAEAKEIDPKWRAPYERIFAGKDRALVPLESGVCGGCHVKLPPSAAHDVRKLKDIVTCDYCGRMLYYGGS